MAEHHTEAPTKSAIVRQIKRAQTDIWNALRKNEDSAVKEVLDLLKTLQTRIQQELFAIQGERFAASHLRRLNAIVDAAISDFERRANLNIRDRTRASTELNAAYWNDFQRIMRPGSPTAAAVPPVLSQEMIAVIQALPTELIRGLSQDMAGKVKASLQRAVLGVQTPFEAAKQIANIVGPRGNVGAGAAAERIVRTEMGRAFNVADDLVGQKIADARPADLPPLKKIWIATIDARSREGHGKPNAQGQRAHLQVRDLDEPFDVNGEKLDYPQDPKGSPGNTINCRCGRVLVPEDLVDETKQEYS